MQPPPTPSGDDLDLEVDAVPRPAPTQWPARAWWLVDVIAIASLIAAAVTGLTVLFLHVTFFVLTVAAMALELRSFRQRAALYGAVAIALVVRGVVAGTVPADALAEIPLLGAIFALVVAGANRRERSLRSQQLAHEQTLMALDVKETFLRTIGHELATPLHAIQGFAEINNLVIDDGDYEQLRGNNDLIVEQSGRLARLIDDLHTMARIRAGTLAHRPQVVRVEDIIDVALRTVPQVDEVEVRASGDVELFVDPSHAERILVNFLTNALKYGERPVRIVVAVEGASADLCVIDAGPGVPEDLVDRLFEPFERGSNTGGRPGSGLGLAIVQELAAAQGGHAWYQARPDGSCFGVRLPLARARRPHRVVLLDEAAREQV